MPQITQLDNDPTPNNNDLLVTVDVGAGTTKNISREQFFTGAPLPADTVDSQAIAFTTQSITVGNGSSVPWLASGNVFYRNITGSSFATPFTKIISVTVYNQGAGASLQQIWLNEFTVNLSGVSNIREFKATSGDLASTFRIEVIGFI